MTKLSLLIIDDETDICDLIVDIAEGQGFDAAALTNPHEVESYLHTNHPDCIMMDLMMPGIDGVELLRDLADSIKGCNIILMSGHDARVLHSAKRLGNAHGLNIVDALEKPIDVIMLRKKLDELKTLSRAKADRKSEVEAAPVEVEGIVVNYQPIVDLESGKLRGMEALARWRHPVHGILGPGEFMAKLDEEGMNALTRQMMALTVRDTAILNKEGHTLSVSVNMTYSNLASPNILEELVQHCNTQGLAHDRVTVEITEGEVMRDVQQATAVLTQMRLKGFGLAIDDFGTGYSCLRELQRLPFNIMKMDRSFIMDLTDNRSSQVVSHAIIELGHNLGLKVVAEGVETVSVWNHLKERGCDLAQGYFISRPLAMEALSSWIRANQGQFLI
jgi:EAL domain-containing protein (putative c-di-GMP-specific phosphodiesterase class I)